MSAPLAGKVALVTGASRGIGKGIALVLAEQGATVYVTGRTVREGYYYLPGTVGGTAAECDARGATSGGSGIAVACDHGDDEAVAALFARIAAEQGRLDILVNNAFTLSDDLLEPKGFWEKPLSNLEMWDVGVKSNYVAAWHAAKIMAPQKSGLIVAISGFAAVTYTYSVIFGTSKSAVDRMARDMAIELEPHGVASLTLWQGLTLTEKAQDNLAKMGDKMTTSITSMQGSTVEHPGRVVAALAADPEVMKRSGGEFVTAELAQEYGLTDVDGSVIASARATRGSPIWKPVSEVDYRGK
ncbi:SDR family NAD(P)-dependent oxidoreductase [Novosphingobium resinovorum]|uniref:Short-chain dehydrogenase n=1 Tax=Novosphingobium resinovorum TaxID=158500 RepID=A0A031J9Q9_9SPHN|nr:MULTISPECIES: SDR family NAD(P)-dependent oxidoreductase [Novosphingobium]AOR79598.1 short-chain dehydrogenase [Novosphingobium resinovorum]EZP70899.1 Short-chain dehydrogenase/reductase SDR [Novosphingobium resinovorum]MBF7013461.1 SDR family NAD(P)-dependent oxidoreductase [Novosphingobium sp. HR1a]WJM25609.1 SDR family NAD(P)-dependent oxidoreductase [Novosphingobium resinovorum]